jgi:hypothetical protein
MNSELVPHPSYVRLVRFAQLYRHDPRLMIAFRFTLKRGTEEVPLLEQELDAARGSRGRHLAIFSVEKEIATAFSIGAAAADLSGVAIKQFDPRRGFPPAPPVCWIPIRAGLEILGRADEVEDAVLGTIGCYERIRHAVKKNIRRWKFRRVRPPANVSAVQIEALYLSLDNRLTTDLVHQDTITRSFASDGLYTSFLSELEEPMKALCREVCGRRQPTPSV